MNDNLKIRKEDNKWFWSLILSSGKMFCGSCFDYKEIKLKIAKILDEIKAPKMIGIKKNGRWNIKTFQDGFVTDHIVSKFKQFGG